jgi:adenylate cyclase
VKLSHSLAQLGVGVVMTTAVLLIGATPALDSGELRTVDWRFAVRGTQPPPDDVVVVQIDEKTHEDLEVGWPIKRSMHAKVIDWLDAAGAKVIAYDVQFTEPTTVRQDNALIEAVRNTRGRIVLATGDVTEYGETTVLGGTEQVEALGSRVGHSLMPRDRDGVVRRFSREVDGLPGLALLTVEIARRRAVARADFDAHGRAWIDFAGPPRTIRTVSFADVIRGRADRSAFRGAIVVVGAVSAAVQDVHPTTIGRDRQMSGAELHANAIATLLQDVPLRSTPGWLTPVLTLLLGLAIPLAILRFGAIAAVIALPVALLYLGLVQLGFESGLIMPMLEPLIALVLSVAGIFVALFASVSAKGEAARDVLNLFLPASVVDEVLDSWTEGGDLRSLTKSTETTCVFCDLRGFSDFSEMLSEDDVERVLDRYLTEMSDAICAHQGTIVGYRGDGIVALFGAPMAQDDHGDNAVRAAREMAGHRLEQLNRWIAEAGLGDGFDMGIGINSGTIRSGIIGSNRRLEYTAVGDVANVASRLEYETKKQGLQVLVSGATVSVLRNEKPSLAYVGTIEIRGRTAPVSIYGLNGSPVA